MMSMLALALLTPACDLVVHEPQQLRELNNPDVRVICLTPGIYDRRSVGTLVLSASGTGRQPRYLLAYDPASPGDRTHPARLPRDRRVIIEQFAVTGHNWVLDRLVVRNSPASNLIDGGAVGTVINELLIEGVGGAGLYFKRSSNSVVRRTVMRNPAMRPGEDNYHIYIGHGGRALVIEDNEFENGAGAFAMGPDSGGDVVIRNNDMYTTPVRYTDCNGRINGIGPCSCSEMHVVFKGIDSPGATALVESNRMWGARRNDPACASTGSPGHGIYIGAIGQIVRNITIRNNFLWDNWTNGIFVAQGGTDIMVTNNVIHGSIVGIQNTGSNVTIRDNRLIANQTHYVGQGSALGSDNERIDVPTSAESICLEARPITGPQTICVAAGQ